MRIAIDRANEIYEKYGNDPYKICDAIGLTVIEEELAGRLREVYFGDSIVIRKDLPEEEKRELIAHAIGHHLMHAGNHLSMQNRVYSFGNYHERQANVFASYLLIPNGTVEGNTNEGINLYELAESFGVTEDLMTFRLKLASTFNQSPRSKNELHNISSRIN